MNRSELRKQAQRARSGLAHLNDEANRMQNRIDELAAEGGCLVMEYSCTTVRDTYGPICHVVKDRDEYLFRMIDRDEAEQLVNMLNELARLRDATRWRSVGEELPHPTNVVLAWCNYLTPTDAPFKAFYDLGKWWTDEGDPVGVDYWQPLPAPPVEE